MVTSGIFPCLWFDKRRAKYAVVNDISIKREGCGRSGLTNLFWDFGPAKCSPQQRGGPLLSPACLWYVLSSKDCCSPWEGSPGEGPWALPQSLWWQLKITQMQSGAQAARFQLYRKTCRRAGAWRGSLVGLVFVAEMELSDNKKSRCVILNKNIIANIKLSVLLKFSDLRIVCLRQYPESSCLGYTRRHLKRDHAIELWPAQGMQTMFCSCLTLSGDWKGKPSSET